MIHVKGFCVLGGGISIMVTQRRLEFSAVLEVCYRNLGYRNQLGYLEDPTKILVWGYKIRYNPVASGSAKKP